MKNLINNRIFQLCIVLVVGLLLGRIMFYGNKADLDDCQHIDCNGIHESDEATIWTCSMHPQIRQNEPGKCPLCGMDLIPLTTTSGRSEGGTPFVYAMSEEAAALANIRTSKVEYADPEHKIYLSGKIAINEQKQVAITSDYSGRIEKLYADFTGQYINKGDKLVSIYAPELITAQKELVTASKSKETNPALYLAVRNKLKLLRITDAQIDEIEQSGSIVSEMDIYANTSGYVMRRQVSLGDYVNRGSMLFELADLSSVWVVFDAYEQDMSLIRTGQRVHFNIAALPGKDFISTITFVDPLINPQTRTATIRAEADNSHKLLKPEMFVNAQVETRLNADDKILLIPKTAVLWTGKRSVVYVKVPDSEFPEYEMREIILGATAGDMYAVEMGLQEGEEIVMNGVFALDAAAQLSGNYSMMSKPVSRRLSVPHQFKIQLTGMVEKYFALKNSLVQSDFNDSHRKANQMLQSMLSIDMNLLTGDAHNRWMQKEALIRDYTEQIAAAGDIEGQREHFSPLSDVIIELAESFGLTPETVYVAYCPMAFDDEGAYWLSEFPEIMNPYFGDMMLTCGEVRRRISSIDSYQEDTAPRREVDAHQH